MHRLGTSEQSDPGIPESRQGAVDRSRWQSYRNKAVDQDIAGSEEPRAAQTL
jgi:hypothetical protein